MLMYISQLLMPVVDSTADDSCVTEEVHRGNFKWHPVIIDVLQQAPNKQLPVKKLRKKVSQSVSVCLIILV